MHLGVELHPQRHRGRERARDDEATASGNVRERTEQVAEKAYVVVVVAVADAAIGEIAVVLHPQHDASTAAAVVRARRYREPRLRTATPSVERCLPIAVDELVQEKRPPSVSRLRAQRV